MKLLFSIILIAVLSVSACAHDTSRIDTNLSWSKRIADSFLMRHPGGVTYDTGFTEQKWNYEQGLMLWALYQMHLHSGEQKYFDFILNNLNRYVAETGAIRTYKRSDYNLDLVASGRALLVAYEKTGDEKFRWAADSLRQQLRDHPRTNEGGFWHKKIYPYQMWLDGLFMAEPFYAKYAQMFNEPQSFDDIANQFIWIARHTRDPKTGLYYHGWDESKQQRWANPETGCSPSIWGRAMGWFAMGLVDVLDFFPQHHPKRKELLSILSNVTSSLLKFRDKQLGLWYLVVDQDGRKGNYLESSASSMFVYTFAKGATKGYLEKKFFTIAESSFQAIIQKHVTIGENGLVNLHHTIKGAGLGNLPYRDGSFEYYAGEAQRTNDMKGIGPFLLAAIELEKGRVKTSGAQ